MELRDQLAAAALPGLLMAGALASRETDARAALAREAYAIADAMLQVREEASLSGGMTPGELKSKRRAK